MTLETAPWDAAEFLHTEEAVALYLEEMFAEGDAASIAAAIGAVTRARNISAIAKQTGLTRETIYKAFSADGNPTLSTLTAVMKALGYQLAVKPVAA